MAQPLKPEEEARRQIRSGRQLGWAVAGLSLGTGVCFALGYFPGYFLGLLATTLSLIAWAGSGPWSNPFNPD